MGKHAQPVEERDLQDRLEHRAGQTEHDQERAEVGEQEMLDHVHEEQLLRDVPDRRHERHHDQGETRVERELPPKRNRPVLSERFLTRYQ